MVINPLHLRLSSQLIRRWHCRRYRGYRVIGWPCWPYQHRLQLFHWINQQLQMKFHLQLTPLAPCRSVLCRRKLHIRTSKLTHRGVPVVPLCSVHHLLVPIHSLRSTHRGIINSKKPGFSGIPTKTREIWTLIKPPFQNQVILIMKTWRNAS